MVIYHVAHECGCGFKWEAVYIDEAVVEPICPQCGVKVHLIDVGGGNTRRLAEDPSSTLIRTEDADVI